jgi:methylated-DNA-[protein]-cysteine S-methyltransferase
MSYAYKVIDSPVGKLMLVVHGSKLSAILWENDNPNRVRLGPMNEEHDNSILAEAERQLNEYFAGKRNCFELELEFLGTEFQRKVWQALLTIPFGETRAIVRSRCRSADRRRFGRWAPQPEEIPSRSSLPVIA